MLGFTLVTLAVYIGIIWSVDSVDSLDSVDSVDNVNNIAFARGGGHLPRAHALRLLKLRKNIFLK